VPSYATRRILEERLAAEIGRIEKSAPVRVGLLYPSPYSVGMSSLGYQRVYRLIQDARGLAAVLTNQGNIQWTRRELDHAFTMHEEARVLYAQANDLRGVAWSDSGRPSARRASTSGDIRLPSDPLTRTTSPGRTAASRSSRNPAESVA